MQIRNKKKEQERKKERVILWIAGALMIFGCFAPIIFTRTKLFECLDFSNTGEIGDTIGGTMTPIVSLVAVILTYLAFLKQVEANKIQTKQFNLTLERKESDEEKQLENSLELIILDVDFAIQDMEERIKYFDDYLKDDCKRIYGEGILRNNPTVSLSRYRTIDRNLLYNAYMQCIDVNKPMELFRRTYMILDYYSEKAKETISILKKDMQQSNQLHDKITEELDRFDGMMDHEDIEENQKSKYQKTIESFHKEIFSNKELSLSSLDHALRHHETNFAEIDDVEFKDSISTLKKLMDKVKLQNERIVSEIIAVKEKWENETLGELKELKEALNKSL